MLIKLLTQSVASKGNKLRKQRSNNKKISILIIHRLLKVFMLSLGEEAQTDFFYPVYLLCSWNSFQFYI